MIERDPVTDVGCRFEGLPSLGRRILRANIVGDRRTRLGELNLRDMDRIAENDELFASAFNDQMSMSGSVTGRREAADEWHNLDVPSELPDVARIDVRFKALLCLSENVLDSVWRSAALFGIQEKVEVTFWNVNKRILEHALSVEQEAPGVIGMDMCQDYRTDSIGVVPGGAKALYEQSRLWLEEVAGTSVNQDDASAGIDDECIDR